MWGDVCLTRCDSDAIGAALVASIRVTGGRWGRAESNRRRQPFQGCALPTELPPHFWSCLQKP